MAFIAHKERNFTKYLENHFGITLPEGTELFYDEGVRCAGKEAKFSDIHGDKGYAACDAGFNPTNSFIQNFGHLATKNVVDVDSKKAKEFAVGRGLGATELGPNSGFVAVRSEGFVIGLGYYEADKKKRLGEEGARPKRVRFKPIH